MKLVELVAFSQLHSVDLWIHQHQKPIFIIHSDQQPPSRTPLHLAYHHDYEHYDSIRRIDGPWDGLPDIPVLQENQEQLIQTESNDSVANSIEKMIMGSTNCQDLTRIRALMKTMPVDEVIEQLLQEEPEEADDGQELDSTMEKQDFNSLDQLENQDVNGSDQLEKGPDTKEHAAGSKPPSTRKLSARERKHQAKKKRKEARKFKSKTEISAGNQQDLTRKLDVLHL